MSGARAGTSGTAATTGVNRGDRRARRLPLVASHLQADGSNLISTVAELCLQEWQELTKHRSGGVAVHQQAPGGPFDGAGPDGSTQGRRDGSLDHLQPLARFAHELRQPGQRRRLVGGLLQADGLVAAGRWDRGHEGDKKMNFIITDARLARSRAVHLSGTKLLLALVSLSLGLMLMAAGMYHWVILKGARERWPVIGSVVRFVVQDEIEQRDRFMRENLDAMARKLGAMQARMQQLEALGERVGGLASV